MSFCNIKNLKEGDLFSDLTDAQKMEADFSAEVAIQIIKKRTELNMTQKQFAEYAHVSQAMVSRWESGENNFSIQNLMKLFSLLGLKLVIFDTRAVDSPVFHTVSSEKGVWNCSSTPNSMWKEHAYAETSFAPVL